MSKNLRPRERLVAATNLRDAALVLLRKKGKESPGGEGHLVFEQHSPENPTPHLSLSLTTHPVDGRKMLSVWAMRKGAHTKVLNIEWLGEEVQVVSFRRGEWESELLAMGRVSGIALH